MKKTVLTDEGPVLTSELAKVAEFFKEKPLPKTPPRLTRGAQKLARQIAQKAKSKEMV